MPFHETLSIKETSCFQIHKVFHYLIEKKKTPNEYNYLLVFYKLNLLQSMSCVCDMENLTLNENFLSCFRYLKLLL